MWDFGAKENGASTAINKNFLRSIKLVIFIYKSKNRESKDYLISRTEDIQADAADETHFVNVEYVPGL